MAIFRTAIGIGAGVGMCYYFFNDKLIEQGLIPPLNAALASTAIGVIGAVLSITLLRAKRRIESGNLPDA